MRRIRAALAACGTAWAIACAAPAAALDVPAWTRPVPAGKAIVARNDYYAPLLVEVELVRVLPGERVEAGRTIALPGNSGHTSGPHLHFAVKRNRGGEVASVYGAPHGIAALHAD